MTQNAFYRINTDPKRAPLTRGENNKIPHLQKGQCNNPYLTGKYKCG